MAVQFSDITFTVVHLNLVARLYSHTVEWQGDPGSLNMTDSTMCLKDVCIEMDPPKNGLC